MSTNNGTVPQRVGLGARSIDTVPVEERNEIRREFLRLWETAGKPHMVKSIIDQIAVSHNIPEYDIYSWTRTLRPHSKRKIEHSTRKPNHGSYDVVIDKPAPETMPTKPRFRLVVQRAELLVDADSLIEAVSGHAMGQVLSYERVTGAMEEPV